MYNDEGLLVKDKVIGSLEQRVREKDLTIQQLNEDNEKLNEKAKLWAGGTVKFKIGVTPVWREFVLLRNSNVINAYMVFDDKSFLRFEPIANI
jgi:hypothetical protein